MSAPTPHPDLPLVAGDDWAIAGTLLDTNGQPLDLTDATLFEWCLINGDGAQALGPGDAVVAVQSPATAGLIAIVVADEVTAGLAPGRYVDALRVTFNGPRSTMWRGCILVSADLPDIAWAPAVLPPPSPSPISIATGSPAIGAPTFTSPPVDNF